MYISLALPRHGFVPLNLINLLGEVPVAVAPMKKENTGQKLESKERYYRRTVDKEIEFFCKIFLLFFIKKEGKPLEGVRTQIAKRELCASRTKTVNCFAFRALLFL